MHRYIHIARRAHLIKGIAKIPRRALRLKWKTAFRLFIIQVIQPFLRREIYLRLAKRLAEKQLQVTPELVEKNMRKWQKRLGGTKVILAESSIVSISDVVQNEQQLRELRSSSSRTETLLADIDQDGYFLPRGFHLPKLPWVHVERSLPKKRSII